MAAAAETTSVPEPKRQLRLRWWILGVLALLLALFAGTFFYSTSEYFAPELVISRETTYITEPLTPEGLPDYAEALNRRLSEGVTAENNAVVPLLQVLGPAPGSRPLSPAIFARLDMDPLPALGENDDFYFVSIERRLARRLQKQAALSSGGAQWQRQLEQLEHLRQRPWRTEEAPLVAQLLARNRRHLDQVREASRRPRFFLPVVVSSDQALVEMPVQVRQAIRDLACDLQLRAMWHLGHGRVEEAWQDILTIKRLARLVEQDWSMFSMLVGIALEGMAFESAEQVLNRTVLDEATARRFLHQWRCLPSQADAVRAIGSGDRLVMLDAWIQLVRGRMDGRILEEFFDLRVPTTGLDINHGLRLINQSHDQVIEILSGGSLAEVRNGLRAWEEANKDRCEDVKLILGALLNRTARTELVCRMLLDLLLGSYEAVFLAELRVRQWHPLMETALALAVYRARHGRYPQSLQALVPELLAEVPRDLFTTDRKVIYRREENGYLLYSVGPNGRDDGGNLEAPMETWDVGLAVRSPRLPLVAP